MGSQPLLPESERPPGAGPPSVAAGQPAADVATGDILYHEHAKEAASLVPMADNLLCVIGPRPLDRDIVTAAGLPYARLSVGGVNGLAPWRAAPNLLRFTLAVPRAATLIRRFKPDVVLVGGGYVCAPVAVAAALLRVPIVTLCVDVVPGWAVRLAARLSTRVATAFEASLTSLPAAKTVVTGYPVRDEFLHADRAAARRRLGLPADARVVLVFGGSLGARAINRALRGALDRILPVAHVIHVTGHQEDTEAWSEDTVPEAYRDRYHAHTYLDAPGMVDALAAADLAICRAGAATMAELPATGTPAVLIPGEFSAQEGNARALADGRAAVVILDRELDAARLAGETLALLDDPARLARMAAACRALAHLDAADRIANLVRETVSRG